LEEPTFFFLFHFFRAFPPKPPSDAMDPAQRLEYVLESMESGDRSA
jgi:hypothetical protein